MPILLRALTALALLTVTAPAAPARSFNDVASPDGIYVMAIGDSGRIARSWNRGQFWNTDTFGAADLHALDMRDALALMAGSGGRLWRSVDGAGTWTEQVPAGSGAWHDVQIAPDGVHAVAVGDGGRIVRSDDGGVSWSVAASGVTRALRAIAWRDDQRVWAVGDSGSVLRSGDGGATWAAVASGATVDLFGVSGSGEHVWVVGRAGTAYRSENGGATWVRVPLGLGAAVDVDHVHCASADSVSLAGGGGFVRRTADRGATWTFARQPALASIGGFHMAGRDTGWIALRTTPEILTTTDGGLTWAFPPGHFDASRWSNANPWTDPVRGNTIARNPQRPDQILAANGITLYRSNDRGRTWTSFGTLPAGTKTNAFIVSPYDSLKMIAAIGEPDRVVRSTDGGATWSTVIARDFSEFGAPVEMDEAHPDTLLFAPEDSVLYRSLDFGATWDSISTPGLRSPCDIVIVPGEPHNIWIGDGITGVGFGQIFQSLDGGLTFTKRFESAEGSEIPALAVAPLDPRVGLGTQWSRGGVVRTLDGGETWASVSAQQTAWGAAFAPDDPNVVAFGLFSGGATFFSTTQAANFLTYGVQGANYALFALDRGAWLATQSTGLFRFEPAYRLPAVNAAFMTMVSPNGGEQWKGGEVRDIVWESFGVFRVRIEFSPDYDTEFTTIAEVPGYANRFAWRIPAIVASSARIRITPLWGTATPVESQSPFTLSSSFLTLSPGVVDMGAAPPGETVSRVVTLGNPGNLTLDVQSVAPPVSTGGPPRFWASRTSFTIPAFSSDTLTLFYRPLAVQRDTATFTIVTDDPESPHALVAFGQGLPAAFTVSPAAPNPARDRTLIRYTLAAAAHVTLEVFNLAGQRVATLVDGAQAPGAYAVPFGAGAAPGAGIGSAAMPAGVYFYRFRGGPLDVRRKFVLLR